MIVIAYTEHSDWKLELVYGVIHVQSRSRETPYISTSIELPQFIGGMSRRERETEFKGKKDKGTIEGEGKTIED